MSNPSIIKRAFNQILSAMQACLSSSLSIIDGQICLDGAPVEIKPPNRCDNVVEAELDGFIDLLYYVHFYNWRSIKSDKTYLSHKVRDFAEGSDPINHGLPPKILTKKFIFEMVISEMTEVFIAFDLDYVQHVAECISEPDIQHIGVDRDVGVEVELIVDRHLKSIFGLKWMLGFDEVHNANMRKQVDGRFVYNSDGKILKPQGWTEPDMKSALDIILS